MSKDKLRIMLGVWLAVYPSVLLLSYLLAPYDMPLYLSVLISTSLTVPLITYLVVPACRLVIAEIDHKAPEEVGD